MDIKAYLHCKTCSRAGVKDTLEIGLANPTTLAIRCTTCGKDVGNFKLAKAVPMQCDACGEDITDNHTHH